MLAAMSDGSLSDQDRVGMESLGLMFKMMCAQDLRGDFCLMKTEYQAMFADDDGGGSGGSGGSGGTPSFSDLDTDGDQCISWTEFQTNVGKPRSDYDDADSDGNECIDSTEFQIKLAAIQAGAGGGGGGGTGSSVQATGLADPTYSPLGNPSNPQFAGNISNMSCSGTGVVRTCTPTQEQESSQKQACLILTSACESVW